MNVQRGGNTRQNQERRIASPPLDSADIGQVNLSIEGELFLREVARES